MTHERVNTGGNISFVYTEKDKHKLKLEDKRIIERYYQNIELEKERQEVKKYKRERMIKSVWLGILALICILGFLFVNFWIRSLK